MKSANLIFWNVDTQKDFVEPNGKLYAPGAELLKPNLAKLTQLAKQMGIVVVNTADYHYGNSAELSPEPNFIDTFPPHCMAGTEGAGYIAETDPESALIFDWGTIANIYGKLAELNNYRNIVIRKDAFDVFSGNPFTDDIVEAISPKVVVVYGVTTNVCVNDAVLGLSERVEKVYVVEDAIKELPNIPLPFAIWEKLGVKLVKFNDLEKMLSR